MEDFTLTIETRKGSGKTEAARLRRTGFIPAIGYRGGKDAVPFTVDHREFTKQASRALPSQVFTLSGDSPASGMALVKDIQQEGLKGQVTHVDFLLLEAGEPAVVKVPVVIVGDSPGVKNEGGVLNTQCREVVVLSEPKDIPQEIEVSISELKLGDRIRTGDIKLPDGVVLKSNPDETVANVISGRAAKLAEEAAEASLTAGSADVVAEGDASTPTGGDAASGGEASAEASDKS